MTVSRLRWGLLFITVGVMLLLNNAGSLSWGYWADLIVWWPVLLIAIGLEKIFQKTSLHFLAYLSPVILAGGMILVAFDTGTEPTFRNYFSSYRWSEDADSTIRVIDADIDHGRYDFFINGSSFNLASAKFNRFSRKPSINFSKSDGIAKLEIGRRSLRSDGVFVFNSGRYGQDWTMSFSPQVPLKLACRGKQSDVSLNLQSIPLEELKITNDEGDIYLKIGDLSPRVNIEINSPDSPLRLRIPRGAGLRVDGIDKASYFKTMGLLEDKGYFISPGFDTTRIKIMLDIDKGLEHFSIDYY
jgi:hypothetical protein